MSKKETLEQIRQAQREMLDAIDGLSPDAMLRPGVVGVQSVKDLLAHITIWQSELITALSQLENRKQTPEIVNIEDIDGFNEEQYRINARRSLDVVLDDLYGVHKHLLAVVEGLDERTLTDPRKFPWMEGEPLDYLIAENGYWHEQEHAQQIREWRQAEGL